MPSRKITVDGTAWRVLPSGYVTQYDADEFGLLFVRADGIREVRMTRYRPTGARARERSLAELSDATLCTLFASSQPSETSPEGGYSR
jgi:hypothetical protein